MQHAHDTRAGDILPDVRVPCVGMTRDRRSDVVDLRCMLLDESDSGFMSVVDNINAHEIADANTQQRLPRDATPPAPTDATSGALEQAVLGKKRSRSDTADERSIETGTAASVPRASFCKFYLQFEKEFLAQEAQVLAQWQQEQAENAFIAARLAMVAYTK